MVCALLLIKYGIGLPPLSEFLRMLVKGTHVNLRQSPQQLQKCLVTVSGWSQSDRVDLESQVIFQLLRFAGPQIKMPHLARLPISYPFVSFSCSWLNKRYRQTCSQWPLNFRCVGPCKGKDTYEYLMFPKLLIWRGGDVIVSSHVTSLCFHHISHLSFAQRQIQDKANVVYPQGPLGACSIFI